MGRYFSADTFDFLQDLEVHNERDWFKANQERYESVVRGPMLQFIEDLEAPMQAKVSPRLTADARKVGGSLFRIQRDVRFSNDKSPYKTNTGAFFRHDAGKDVTAPGLYLHLEPGNCFMGGGVYRPPNDALKKLRTAVVDAPDDWLAVRDAPAMRNWEFGGDSLKRAPKGFDADLPLIEDLRRTSFIVSRPLTEKQMTSTKLLDLFVDRGAEISPFVAWVASALGLDF